MIENAKTKNMRSEVGTTADSSQDNTGSTTAGSLFHFSGSGKYFPLAIIAHSREEAEKLWEQKRVPYKK